MRNILFKSMIICLIFFIGSYCIITLDSICMESTGCGGKLVLDVEKIGLFN